MAPILPDPPHSPMPEEPPMLPPFEEADIEEALDLLDAWMSARHESYKGCCAICHSFDGNHHPRCRVGLTAAFLNKHNPGR